MKISKSVFLVVVILSLALFRATAVAGYAPHQGDYFNYYEVQNLGNGTGSYAGYSEHEVINGGETIDAVTGGVVSANYSYSYTWSNSASSTEAGTQLGAYTFSPTNFLYINGTDDQQGYVNPTVWFAMNNALPVDNTFTLLNTQMTVVSTNYSYYLPSVNRDVTTIFARGNGSYVGSPNDNAYGNFNAKYTWNEYFDPTTGYVIGYTYAEQDVSPNGNGTGFGFSDDLYVTSTSYSLSTVGGVVYPSTSTSASISTSTTTTSTNNFPMQYVGYIAIALVILIVVILIVVLSRSRRNLTKHSYQQEYSRPSSGPPQDIKLTPEQPPQQIVIKEVAKVNCKFCGTLIDSTADIALTAVLPDSELFMKMKGLPVELNIYEASEVQTNKHFQEFKMPDFEKVYLPDSMKPFTDLNSLGQKEFVVDDNRSVVDPHPSLAMDGTDFYLSVKGIGSTTSPFSRQPIGKAEICSLLKNPNMINKIMNARETTPRYLTGEQWSRGSPYGVQGLQYANIAMRASEMADLTSIHGFRIAPLVKIVPLPGSFQNEIKKIYWYRRFKEQMVQETRLVPSNVRIYFHSDYTVGDDVCSVFDLFGIDNNDRALQFEKNFVKSGMAILTLFVRSIKNNADGTYSGLDFYDVWLDKDAVVAPDGTIYWADNEGLEWITVWEKDIEEKMEYQIYRSLYELMYAYEQIERERSNRFGHVTNRKIQFEYLLKDAMKDDEVIDLAREGSSLQLIIGNILGEQSLTKKFTIIDWD